MKKMSLTAFCALLALPALLSAGCNLASMRESFDKEEGKKVLANAKFDRVLIDSTGEIEVYASMNRSQGFKNKDAILSFSDPYKELYLLVMKEDVPAFASALENVEDMQKRLAKYYSAGLMPPDTALINIYGELTTNASVKKLENGRDSLLSDRKLHGLQYKAYAITGSYKKIPLFYLKGIYKSTRHFYQVVVWTLGSRRNLYEGVMQKMIESLQEESNVPASTNTSQ